MGSEAVPLNYIPILMFIVIAIAFGAVHSPGRIVRPSRPYRAKLAPYESGSPLFRMPAYRFPMRYYIIAMLFVIFDIEIVYMFPWAVAFSKLGFVGLVGNGDLYRHPGRRVLVRLEKRGAGMGLKGDGRSCHARPSRTLRCSRNARHSEGPRSTRAVKATRPHIPF